MDLLFDYVADVSISYSSLACEPCIALVQFKYYIGTLHAPILTSLAL